MNPKITANAEGDEVSIELPDLERLLEEHRLAQGAAQGRRGIEQACAHCRMPVLEIEYVDPNGEIVCDVCMSRMARIWQWQDKGLSEEEAIFKVMGPWADLLGGGA